MQKHGTLSSSFNMTVGLVLRVVLLLSCTVLVISCDSDDEVLVTGDQNTPADLARCFAFSIDQVGRGNLEAGIEKFTPCLAEDYTFEFRFAEGAPAIVCPSTECPVQDFSSVADLRAGFANAFFVDAGYLATQHQILNIDVSQNGNRAEVFAYIQANHFKADNSVDIAWNDYSFVAVRENGLWVVESEEIVGTAFLNFQGAPVGG